MMTQIKKKRELLKLYSDSNNTFRLQTRKMKLENHNISSNSEDSKKVLQKQTMFDRERDVHHIFKFKTTVETKLNYKKKT